MCDGGGGKGEGDLYVVGFMFISPPSLFLMTRTYVCMNVMINNLWQVGKALFISVCFDIQHIHSLTSVTSWALANYFP